MIFLKTITTTSYSIDWGFIKIIETTGSFLLAVGTFIIAWKLYDRHGLRKILFEKKLKVVLELAETIKNFPIQINAYDNENNYETGAALTIYPAINLDKIRHLEYLLPFYNCQITSTIDYILFQLEKFRKFQSNPYLPKQISDSLNFLSFEYTNSTPTSYAEIKTTESINAITNEKVTTIPSITLEEYIKGYQGTLIEIKKWLDKNTNMSDHINL